jgi:hypothetical protein
MGNQAISIVALKNETPGNTTGKHSFFMHMQNMQNMYQIETKICRICNNEYESVGYGIKYVK